MIRFASLSILAALAIASLAAPASAQYGGLGVFATSAPSTNAGTPTTRYGGDTNYCGDPVAWLVWRIGCTTYKIPAYT